MAQGDFTRINTNIGALNALNSLKSVQSKLGVSQLRLATGKRINESADDPAGLTIATKFNYRATGLGQALDNIGDAKNMLAVAEGGLQKINDILNKMRDKATQAASDTLGSAERYAIKNQLDDFASEINDIVQTTKWNGNKLLDGLGDFGNTVTFQVGVETATNNQLTLTSANFGRVDTTGLNIGTGSATVATVSDGGDIVNAIATADTSASLTELNTGTYTFRVVIGTNTNGSTSDSYIQLLGSGGTPQWVEADGNGDGGLIDNKVTFAYNSTTTRVINFGNGLSITLDSGLATGTTEATVSYARGGSYSGQMDTADNARAAITALEAAISTVSTRLQTVGAMVSRLNFREETVTIAKVNTEAAYSRIMDADMAFEQLQATKYQILQQTATAMLSQANTAPQGVLSLFRG